MDAKDAYIGTRGGEFVTSALTSGDLDVTAAIERVQQRGALRNPDCEPLLGLLDHMGQSRAEASTHSPVRWRLVPRAERPLAQVYHAMLGTALGQLKERIRHLPHSALLKLLEVRASGRGSTDRSPLSAVRLGVVSVHQAGGGARRAARRPGNAPPGAAHVPEAGTLALR